MIWGITEYTYALLNNTNKPLILNFWSEIVVKLKHITIKKTTEMYYVWYEIKTVGLTFFDFKFSKITTDNNGYKIDSF